MGGRAGLRKVKHKMSTYFPAVLDEVLKRANEDISDVNEESPIDDIVQAQVGHLGKDPSLIEVATMLLKQSTRAEHEARQARLKQEKELIETIRVVKANREDLADLKVRSDKSEKSITDIYTAQNNAEQRIAQVEFFMNKSYYLACETRQKNSKGNFILSGRHIPRQKSGENIIWLVREIVNRKYGVDINPYEFKAIHRLAGERIFFSLHSRLPGMAFHDLVSKMNSNPNPELEAYMSIQLFEPYSDLFYLARRLKFHKVISYYRLDENGTTHIALKENSRSFKFTNVDQLRQLNVNIPQEIYKEVYQRKLKNAELESQAASQVLSRAREVRPIVPEASDMNNRSSYSNKTGGGQQILETSNQPREDVTLNKAHTPGNADQTGQSSQPHVNSHQILVHPQGNYQQDQQFLGRQDQGSAAVPSNRTFQPTPKNKGQLQPPLQSSEGLSTFRFPTPNHSRLNSAKRGRSSASSSTSVNTEAQNTVPSFNSVFAERPRHTVKEIVQFYPNNVPFGYQNI